MIKREFEFEHKWIGHFRHSEVQKFCLFDENSEYALLSFNAFCSKIDLEGNITESNKNKNQFLHLIIQNSHYIESMYGSLSQYLPQIQFCNSHVQNLHGYVSLHICKYTQVCKKSHK